MSNWVIYKSPERMGSIHSYVFENENASEMRGWAPGGWAGRVSCVVTWKVPSCFCHTRSQQASWGHYQWALEALMKRHLLHLLKVERKAGVIQLWYQVVGRASHGHAPLLSFAETVSMKPLPRFPLYHLLCRDLLYVSIKAKGLFFSSSVLENWKLSETRKK